MDPNMRGPVAMIEVVVDLMQESRNKEAIMRSYAELKKKIYYCNPSRAPQHAVSACSFALTSRQLPLLPEGESVYSPDCTFELFNRAFVISGISQLALASNNAMLRSVLLYNLAQAYHRAGIDQKRCFLLKKALQMYQMAESSLWSLDRSVDPTLSRLLLIAITNNMGFLHSVFFNIDEARKCRLSIQSYLESAPSEEEDVSFFRMNLIFLQDRPLGAPVA